jgi:kynurenine formamidase
MKVRENKDVFGHNCVCQSARASLEEKQTRVQEVPGPSTRPGNVGLRGQKPCSDKYFHGAFTRKPHESWLRSRSGKVRIVLVGLDNPFTDAAVNEPSVGPFPPMPSWEQGSNPWLPFGVHHHTLTQAGVHQIQNLNLTEMAQKQMHLGAVFILPLRLKGGSGSPVRPVVIGHPNDYCG